MDENISDVENMIGDIPKAPILSGIEDTGYQIAITQKFMTKVESVRSWLAISFSEWLCAAKWWFLNAQETVSSSEPNAVIPTQTYADLLKGSWILVDVFAPTSPTTLLGQRVFSNRGTNSCVEERAGCH
jgi:hypothetical protein